MFFINVFMELAGLLMFAISTADDRSITQKQQRGIIDNYISKRKAANPKAIGRILERTESIYIIRVLMPMTLTML